MYVGNRLRQSQHANMVLMLKKRQQEKSSKAMAALCNIIFDTKWLSNLHIYVRFE